MTHFEHQNRQNSPSSNGIRLLSAVLSAVLPVFYVVFLLVSCGKKKPPDPAAPPSTAPPTTPTTPATAVGASKTTNTGTQSKDKNVSKESRFGEQSTELKTFKDKSNVKLPEDPDLKSRTNYDIPKSEAKPVSAFMPAKNDKFVSKGGGIFVDKDGNPISQLAEPPAKDAPT